jgi:hypothetical protein
MLRFHDTHRLPSGILTRRDWLGLGTLSSLGWLLGGTMSVGRADQARGTGPRRSLPGFGRAKSVIIVFASGGQSQIDTWDPKPNAPLDVRGDFRPISTSMPGVHFCEHLPRVASVADRLTVVRSMSHEDLDHGSAAYLTMTGRYHVRRSANPPPSPTDFPTLGAILRRVRPDSTSLSEAVYLNGPALVPSTPAPGQDGGFLGRAYEPLLLGDVRSADMQGLALTPPDSLSLPRIQDRLTLKESLDQYLGQLASHPRTLDLSQQYREAYRLLESPKTRKAFQLEDEPEKMHERYGRHRPGQACLLARRLVEAGVPLIHVNWSHSNRGQDQDPTDTELYGWDTHNDIFDALKRHLLPWFDVTFATLIEDLDARGLLDETLVVCLGEFGRAPQVALEPRFAGSTPGRKHWSSVYSIVLAGAGVKRGAVLGASDRMGAEPTTERFGPWDVAATIFHALGIDPASHYTDSQDRPFLLAEGTPMLDLY